MSFYLFYYCSTSIRQQIADELYKAITNDNYIVSSAIKVTF